MAKKISVLKKARVAAGLTQAQVAGAMDVSQPNYQRWETGVAEVPIVHVKKLARALKMSADEILPPNDSNVYGRPDDQAYFGEATIHFATLNALCLPLTFAEANRLHRDLDGDSEVVAVQTLDNRTVIIRRNAIKEVQINHDGFDWYGPRKRDADGEDAGTYLYEYGDQHMGAL